MLILGDALGKLGVVCVLAFAVILAVESAHAAQFELLHQFQGGSDGEFPEAGLTADGLGNLYGTTFGTLGGGPGKVCSKTCGNLYSFVDGGGLNTQYFFQAGQDGAFPTGEVVIRTQTSTIYGTTEFGGRTSCGGLGCGTAFSQRGNVHTVFQFCTSDFPYCTNGAVPRAGPIIGNDGNIYGTTTLGGSANGYLCDNNFEGCGTVYRLTHDLDPSKVKVVYSFCSQPNCADGAVPLGKLLSDSAGNLYGTTEFGGAYSQGTAFELQFVSNGSYSYKVLYNFCSQANCTDGSIPEAGLIVDSAGSLYGTTTYGGGTPCNNNPGGCGVVFKLAQSGGVWTETVLYAFKGGNDGEGPQASLVPDDVGNLYGTTLKGGGGPYCNNKQLYCGTVFELAADGMETILYAFGTTEFPSSDKLGGGTQPEGVLVWQKPYLYGATRIFGSSLCSCGTLYRINTQANTPVGSWRSHGLPPQWERSLDRKRGHLLPR